jgi:hypothetical protein
MLGGVESHEVSLNTKHAPSFVIPRAALSFIQWLAVLQGGGAAGGIDAMAALVTE